MFGAGAILAAVGFSMLTAALQSSRERGNGDAGWQASQSVNVSPIPRLHCASRGEEGHSWRVAERSFSLAGREA